MNEAPWAANALQRGGHSSRKCAGIRLAPARRSQERRTSRPSPQIRRNGPNRAENAQSGEFLNSEPLLAFRVRRLAAERRLASDGYEITPLNSLGSCDHFLAAASHLGVAAEAKQELAHIVASSPDAPSLFPGVVSRRWRTVFRSFVALKMVRHGCGRYG